MAQAYAGRPPLILNHHLAVSALGALPAEFDRARAGRVWREAGIPEDDHDGLWEAFDAAGLFAEGGDDPASWWDELGWAEAHTYHYATRDYPFLQKDEPGAFERDTEIMDAYSEEAPQPSSYQHLGDGSAVALPSPGAGESADDWLARLSPEERMGQEGLALLLDVCFGERGQLAVAGGGQCLLKSIPSGGARHPTEVFVATFDVPGIDPGIYHHDVEHGGLEQVSSGQQRDAFAHATLDLFDRYEAPPAAALVFTSLVERAMWRYRDPRSFRAILVDVGHAVMAYRVVSEMLGFRIFGSQKMRDSEVAELLRIDRTVQPPLYAGTLVP